MKNDLVEEIRLFVSLLAERAANPKLKRWLKKLLKGEYTTSEDDMAAEQPLKDLANELCPEKPAERKPAVSTKHGPRRLTPKEDEKHDRKTKRKPRWATSKPAHKPVYNRKKGRRKGKR